MEKGFLNLATHTVTYGQGILVFIDPVKYVSSLLLIALANKAMILVMLAGVFTLFYQRFVLKPVHDGLPSKEFRILLALVVSQFGSILMVAKHYHNNHYLFPALSLTGFVMLFVYLSLELKLTEKSKRIFRFSLPALVVLVIAFSLLNIPFMTLAYNGYRSSNKSTDETFTRLDRDYRDYVKVYYYPVSFNEYSSLRWGNVYSRLYSTDKLMQLFPEGLFYNAWDKSFQLWETNISVREFVKTYGSRILLVGGPRTAEELLEVEKGGLKLKKLFESRVQVVFEIDTAESQLFIKSTHNRPPVWSLHNDLELFSPDGEWILSADGSRFSKNSSLATDKSRSGKKAFKLPDLDSYVMEYEITDVSPGDMYEINIWQYGNSQHAYLVASSGGTDPYYQQSKGYVETDKQGWKKVILDFKIPANFKGNKLKIYLWNHGEIPVWFDDFEVEKYK